jgi:hypothetical protein
VFPASSSPSSTASMRIRARCAPLSCNGCRRRLQVRLRLLQARGCFFADMITVQAQRAAVKIAKSRGNSATDAAFHFNCNFDAARGTRTSRQRRLPAGRALVTAFEKGGGTVASGRLSAIPPLKRPRDWLVTVGGA